MEYTLEKAQEYRWGSVTGLISDERKAYLKKHLRGPRVLDVGCGGGGYVDFCAQQGFQAAGVEKHPDLLSTVAAKGYQGEFFEGDALQLPFPDKNFDSSYCLDVLEHIDDVQAICEMARITKHRIVVAVPHIGADLFRHGLTFKHDRDRTHLRNYTKDTLRQLLQTVEPRSIEIFYEGQICLPRMFIELSRPPMIPWFFPRLTLKIWSSVLYRSSYRPLYAGVVGVAELHG
jgi:ubiquinone/menaquinone biosynthesis C-methylase UbiE